MTIFSKQYLKAISLSLIVIIIGLGLLYIFTYKQPVHQAKKVYTPGINLSTPKRSTTQGSPLSPSSTSAVTGSSSTSQPTVASSTQPSQLVNTGPGDFILPLGLFIIVICYLIRLYIYKHQQV